MSGKAEPDVKGLIVEALGAHPYRPTSLLEHLINRNPRITETDFQIAVSRLMDERVIELAPDRQIHLRSHLAVAAG